MEFCSSHQVTSSRLGLFKKHITLISRSFRCSHKECTKCHKGWEDKQGYTDDEGERDACLAEIEGFGGGEAGRKLWKICLG